MKKDKKGHLIAGFLIGLLLNFWFAALAGAAKEIYDYLNPKNHTVELADFLFTAAGGLIATLIKSVII
ncbi:hypothetical protein DFR79_106172 [Halanaerobium saccharolyticum]|uniref:Uncharacterized protein n=1 Tax=Halanaerobium saccharolyticum TaxID=43595 RepID=A0A4R6LY70_9FIRM|nr:hypothetical protein [Halanaerobium saccharolyticum]TDO92359.1 hypothetical protein DFR79_106172 [Halanaerobium saccharolyticum]